MKAIETKYKGYKFRSRLEARWAVFFDTLGVPYEYEPEGFDVDGIWYLPDFWLPEQNIWIEIKPIKLKFGQVIKEWPEYDVWGKVAGFAASQNGQFVILCGQPGHPEERSSYSGFLVVGEKQGDCDYWWCECSQCRMIGIQYEGRAARLPCRCMRDSDRGHSYDSERLLAAYDKAREARFEHGSS